MTTTREFIEKAQTDNNSEALRAIEQIESGCRKLRITIGGRQAVARIQYLRDMQCHLGLLIMAEGRATLVDDLRAAEVAKPAPTRESLVEELQAVARALAEFDNTDDEDSDDSDDEDSDDPPEPERYGIFLKGPGLRSASFPNSYETPIKAENALKYQAPAGGGSSLPRSQYEVRRIEA